MIFAETLIDQECRRAQLMTFTACWFGCISEVMIDKQSNHYHFYDNDARRFFRHADYLYFGICSMLFMIPCAEVIPRLGIKQTVKYALLW